MSERPMAFPVGYHIGAPLARASRRSYFRPSQPTDLLFPGIGMIFHDIFWIKHILYCVKKGYKILSRDTNHLERLAYFFMPVNRDKSIQADERARDSILFALLTMPESVKSDSFSSWATGDGAWLFREKGWVNDLKAKISSWTDDFDESIIIGDINHVLGGGLRSKLMAMGIDIDQIIRQTFIKSLQEEKPIDRETVASRFCSLVWEFVEEAGHIRYNPIGENIAFVELCLFPQEDFDLKDSPHLPKIANRDFKGDTGYSETEKEILLKALEATQYGMILIESIILTDALVTICKKDLGYDGEGMRNAYENLIKKGVEIKGFIKDKYSFLNHDSTQLFNALLIRALGWEWNVFLLDGEHIIKDILFDRLLSEDDGLPTEIFRNIIINKETVIKKELSSLGLDSDTIELGVLHCTHAYAFLESLSSNPKKFDKFEALYHRHQSILSDRVNEALKMNVELLNNVPPQKIFEEYLLLNGIYEITSDRIRLIDDSNVSPPFMAGYGAFSSWFDTLRRGSNGRS